MEILTSAAHVVRLNNPPDRQQPIWKEVANDPRPGQTRISIRPANVDEQSSQKTSTRRELLEFRQQKPVSITVQQSPTLPALRRQDLPGLPQLEPGISSSAFLAQQLSQLQEQVEQDETIHEAAANAYTETFQRSTVVLGFQGGRNFLA